MAGIIPIHTYISAHSMKESSNFDEGSKLNGLNT